MQVTTVVERIAPLRGAGRSPAETIRPLNLTVIYEDLPTRQWAGEVCDRVSKLVGPEAVRTTWWRMNDLREPAVLAGAVSTAMRADVIVVAIHAAEGFPLPFYVWVDSWLPYRRPGNAALLALISVPEVPTLQMERARQYLCAVARQSHLDFLSEDRKLRPKTVESTPAGLCERWPDPPAVEQPLPRRFGRYAARRWPRVEPRRTQRTRV